jgi:hypothetical protein
MNKKTMIANTLLVLASILLLTAPAAWAEQPCSADINCDGRVTGPDIALLANEFGILGCDPSTQCHYCVEPPAPVPKTGQTTCYADNGTEENCAGTGQDGEHQAGVAWPEPRFTDNLDGTVTDNLTGLIWLKDANCFSTRTWDNALSDCNGLANESCGLTDGSQAGDWRLPNRYELESLLDMSNYNPALPTGHPFSNVQSIYYWSGTSYAFNTDSAWYVYLPNGGVSYIIKTIPYCVWPVRSDND